MLINPVSDIHLEFADWTPSDVGADVLVLAGDIGTGLQGVEAAIKWSNHLSIPVVMVAGNHDFYGQRFPSHLSDMRRLANTAPKVHLLENGHTFIKGVNFLGCTLWTDFELYGVATEAQSRLVARKNMNDYGHIRHDDNVLLNPLDTQSKHRDSVAWLQARLQELPDGPTVVVTHHAPSESMLNPRHRQRQDRLSPAFASNLERLMGPNIHTWISGHTHFNTQTVINGTRLVSNCRGYPDGIEQVNASGFDSQLVIDVS